MIFKKLLEKREWTVRECLDAIGLEILSDIELYKRYKTLFDSPNISKSGDFYPLPLRNDFLNYVTKDGYTLSNNELMLNKEKVIQWAIDNKIELPAQIYKYYVLVMMPELEINKKTITKSDLFILKGLIRLCGYNFKLYFTK